MIIRIVKMTFQPEKVNEFLELFERSKQSIRNMPGCTHLELLNDVSAPNIFFTYSYWENETHLDHYRNSDVFGDVWPRTKVLFAAEPKAWSLSRHTVIE